MSTQKETAQYILEKLGNSKAFSVRAMFGEYALYAEGFVVALICNDQLYVKDVPESQELADYCDMDAPFSRAKDYFLIENHHYEQVENLSQILLDIATAKTNLNLRLGKKINATTS
jgi:hypothetical protein